jgi:hypothetical protein
VRAEWVCFVTGAAVKVEDFPVSASPARLFGGFVWVCFFNIVHLPSGLLVPQIQSKATAKIAKGAKQAAKKKMSSKIRFASAFAALRALRGSLRLHARSN